MNAKKAKHHKLKLETNFLAFVCYFFKLIEGHNFKISWHHRKIAQVLQMVADGKITRLIINIPPRYSKTEMVVIMFIAWCIAKNPAANFIHLSYAEPLVLDNSSRIKELIEMEEFQELWSISLKKDSKAKQLWHTSEQGGLYACPAGGAVLGFGAGSTNDEGPFAGAMIIDDPLKPDDAESDLERNKVNKRLNTTIKSRLNSRKTPIIMIMQRLHEEDPSGFCLDGGTGDKWAHLNIPVRIKGKPLWPWKHTAEELDAMEAADRFTFSGQYLQQPIPDEGIYFQRVKFRWYEDLPKHLNYYGSSDYAVTEGAGDWTEHGVFGIDPDDNIYFVDWWTAQAQTDVWIETQLDLVETYDIKLWGGESGVIKRAIEPFLLKSMTHRRIYCSLDWLPNGKNDKSANARTFQGLLNNGKVYLPRNKQVPVVVNGALEMRNLATEILQQLLKFPLAKHDDKVDVCSIFARMINQMWKARIPKASVEKKTDAWGRERQESDSWKVA